MQHRRAAGLVLGVPCRSVGWVHPGLAAREGAQHSATGGDAGPAPECVHGLFSLHASRLAHRHWAAQLLCQLELLLENVQLGGPVGPLRRARPLVQTALRAWMPGAGRMAGVGLCAAQRGADQQSAGRQTSAQADRPRRHRCPCSAGSSPRPVLQEGAPPACAAAAAASRGCGAAPTTGAGQTEAGWRPGAQRLRPPPAASPPASSR